MNQERSLRGGAAAWVVAAGALAGASALAAAPGAGPAEAGPAVVFESKELSLTYVGFTSLYSCEGLRRHVEDALAALGAGPGLTVRPYGCAAGDRPERFPALKIAMRVPRPAGAGEAAAGSPSHWKTVQLGGFGGLEPGDCELAEQIRHEILPLFTIRNVQAEFTCIPHHQTAGSLTFSVQVLVPDSAGTAPVH